MAQKASLVPTERGLRIASILRNIVLILLLGFLVLPFAAFIMNSLAIRWFYPQFIPNTWSVEAWETVFNDDLFGAMQNSIVIA